MAGRIDSAAFFPNVPEGASYDEKIEILQNSLMRIHETLAFTLGNIRASDLSQSARAELVKEASNAIVVGVRSARLWSSYAEGEVIPEGAYVIYKGILYQAKKDYGRYESFSPDSAVGNEYWQIAT